MKYVLYSTTLHAVLCPSSHIYFPNISYILQGFFSTLPSRIFYNHELEFPPIIAIHFYCLDI